MTAMTIPEQAVEAAAEARYDRAPIYVTGRCCQRFKIPFDKLPPADRDVRLAAARADLTAAQSHMGLQRPEDVARTLFQFDCPNSDWEEEKLIAKRHGLAWPTFSTKGYYDRAAAVLALPHTAQPAPGHTDLMVSPENIDAFMEKHPLPEHTGQPQEGAREALCNLIEAYENDVNPNDRSESAIRHARAEIARLNEWADGFSDAQLKERRLCEERIQEMQRTIDKLSLALMMIREGCADPAKFAGERLAALSASPPPPVAESGWQSGKFCPNPKCKAGREEWWGYCAMCGYHIASGTLPFHDWTSSCNSSNSSVIAEERENP